MTATAEPEDAAPLTGEEHIPQFFGHPRGLWYLAFTEAWERFSYYGMQALLVLYMVKHLLLPGRIEHVIGFASFRQLYGGIEGQALASAIFGTYAASVYLTPIFGGFLADRLLGRRRTVLLGALTMAAGHFLMAFEGAFLFALLELLAPARRLRGRRWRLLRHFQVRRQPPAHGRAPLSIDLRAPYFRHAERRLA